MDAFNDIRERIVAPRYCAIPFPPYRYLPGRDPHPTANPRGHSYRPPGAPPHLVTWYPPDRWRDSPDYLYGCDLYNHAYWWEAHEAWEGLWQMTDKSGAQGRFLQALIQVSACQLKIHQGEKAGVTRLRQTSMAHMAASKTASLRSYMGLSVARWEAEVIAYWKSLATDGDAIKNHNPFEYPYLHLDQDAGIAP